VRAKLGSAARYDSTPPLRYLASTETRGWRPLEQGEWKLDRRHGYGVCFFADGTKFRGEWEEDCWVQSTADPEFSKVLGPGLARGVAGEDTIFGVEARDEMKNKRLCGGDEFTCRLDGPGGCVVYGNVQDNDDGARALTPQSEMSERTAIM
jgi:hypothetical protein